jgi:hypothetical protein
MTGTFDTWNKTYSEAMDKDGLDPAKASAAADAHVLRELNKKAKP